MNPTEGRQSNKPGQGRRCRRPTELVPCLTQSRVGTYRSGAQYPRDALFKGPNIQEFSVGDTSTLHPLKLRVTIICLPVGDYRIKKHNNIIPKLTATAEDLGVTRRPRRRRLCWITFGIRREIGKGRGGDGWGGEAPTPHTLALLSKKYQ